MGIIRSSRDTDRNCSYCSAIFHHHLQFCSWSSCCRSSCCCSILASLSESIKRYVEFYDFDESVTLVADSALVALHIGA